MKAVNGAVNSSAELLDLICEILSKDCSVEVKRSRDGYVIYAVTKKRYEVKS